MTKDEQIAIQRAMTKLRNAQEHAAEVRKGNVRREQAALEREEAARTALAEAQKAAGLVVGPANLHTGDAS